MPASRGLRALRASCASEIFSTFTERLKPPASTIDVANSHQLHRPVLHAWNVPVA
jgi:hypothetical protein